MGAIGSIFVAILGIVWTLSAISMGAPGFFALFGVVFVIMAIAGGLYNLKNATGKNRYSSFDITDGNEEPDPLNSRFGEPIYNKKENKDETSEGKNLFCPYCGGKVQHDFEYCRQCGKKLP